MKKRIFAGLLTMGLSVAVFAIPAQAGCGDSGRCNIFHAKSAHNQQTYRLTHARTGKVRHYAQARVHHRRAALAIPASHGTVVAMIESMAPAYGVPTWFALRIAKVESGYNPNARGSHGELGVFQMKCATARGIGYRGTCAGLLNASTGVEYGLKHLALAIRSSGGNLQLAASKHNGGLGRRSLVPRYVAQVF